MKMRASAVLFASVALSSCSIGKDLPQVTRAIDSFHRDLNAGKIVQLVQQAGPELLAGDPVRVSNLLLAVHRKLGAFQSGKVAGWNDNFTGGGHFLAIAYEARYAKGPATEQFTYRLGGKSPVLVGYHVNAEALILN